MKILVTSLVALLLQGKLHEAHTGNKAYAEESVVFHLHSAIQFFISNLIQLQKFTFTHDICLSSQVQLLSGVNDI